MLGGPCIDLDKARELDHGEREHNRNLYAKGLRPSSALGNPVFRLQGPLSYTIIDHDKYSSHHSLGIGRRHYS